MFYCLCWRNQRQGISMEDMTMPAPRVIYKFQGRRKAEDFILYPPREDKLVMFQSDKSIGLVDLETGKGKLYQAKQAGYTTSAHLSLAPVIDMPGDFIEAVKAAMPRPGTSVILSGVCQVDY